MPKLLAICDYPVNTGFGIVAQNVLGNLPPEWDVAVLGINYRGDPHELQKKHRIYTPGSDVYGFEKLKGIMNVEKPDVIWVLNDIWLAREYFQRIRNINENIPIVISSFKNELKGRMSSKIFFFSSGSHIFGTSPEFNNPLISSKKDSLII